MKIYKIDVFNESKGLNESFSGYYQGNLQNILNHLPSYPEPYDIKIKVTTIELKSIDENLPINKTNYETQIN